MQRKVIVTGATRGIGRAIASLLLKKNYAVFGTGTKDSALRCADWPDLNGVHWIDVDFSNPQSFDAFLEKLPTFGHFWGLVNNAGVNRILPTKDVSESDYDLVHTINQRCPYFLSRAVLEGMTANGEGRIVNIGSIWSVITKAHRSLYSSAKTGITGLTRALAAEFGKSGILINTVSPGFVLTDLTRESLTNDEIDKLSAQVPVGRMAEPDDIAQVVAFLLSQENRYLSGQNVVVDGGFSIV